MLSPKHPIQSAYHFWGTSVTRLISQRSADDPPSKQTLKCCSGRRSNSHFGVVIPRSAVKIKILCQRVQSIRCFDRINAIVEYDCHVGKWFASIDRWLESSGTHNLHFPIKFLLKHNDPHLAAAGVEFDSRTRCPATCPLSITAEYSILH